jgi:GlpG protein
MRQIATLPSDRAELFADYLLTLGIETKLDSDGAGTILWVCDEDKLPRAKSELETFQRDPSDARYGTARRKAADIRQEAEEEEEDYQEQSERFREEMEAAGQPPPVVLTLGLILICVATFSAKRSDKADDPTYRSLRIDSGEKVRYEIGKGLRGEEVRVPDRLLADVRAGEVWRLLTPALLHFGIAHLVMNMMALLYFGGAIESRLGAGRLLLLLLALALFSNLAEYLLGGGLGTVDGRLTVVTSITFGGMSGVLYGLLGYIWYKGRYRPDVGLDVPASVVMVALVWFVMCWAMPSWNIANVAHTAGLLGGLALGALPDPRLEPEPEPEEAT